MLFLLFAHFLLQLCHAASMLSSLPNLATIVSEIKDMDFAEIDRWWKNQPDVVRQEKASALDVILRQHCKDCQGPQDVINYKLAFRLACHALAWPILSSLLASTVSKEATWPPELLRFFFVKSFASDQENVELGLSEREKKILVIPLMQVIPIHMLAAHLLTVKNLWHRLNFIGELPVSQLPLSVINILNSFERWDEAIQRLFLREKEAWVKSQNLPPPLTRKAILQLWNNRRDSLDCHLGQFFMLATYTIDFLYELEFIRTPSHVTRASRIRELFLSLGHHRAEWKVDLSGIKYDDYPPDAFEIAGIENDALQVRMEALRVEFWLDKNEERYRQQMAALRKEMSVSHTLVPRRNNSSFRSEVFIPIIDHFGQLEFHNFSWSALPFFLRNTFAPLNGQRALQPSAMNLNTHLIVSTLEQILLITSTPASLQHPIDEILRSLDEVKKLSVKDSASISRAKTETAAAFTSPSHTNLYTGTVRPNFTIPMNLLGGIEMTPQVLFGWLNDRIASYEPNIWWNSAENQTQDTLSLQILWIILRLEERGRLSFMSALEIATVKSALYQLAVTFGVHHELRDKPAIKNSVLKGLLLRDNFTYFSAGWRGSTLYDGHAMFVRIDRQPGNPALFTARLYNTGEGSQHHQLVERSSTMGEVRMAYATFQNLSLDDLERINFFHLPPKGNPQDRDPPEILYSAFPQAPRDPRTPIPEHSTTRGQLSPTCLHTIIRLLLRDILGNVTKARLLRHEISGEMIRMLKASQGIRFSPFYDFYLLFLTAHAQYTVAKLQRQVAECKTEAEFRWMLRVIQIYREDIFTIDGHQRIAPEERELRFFDYSPSSIGASRCYPKHLSDLAVKPLIRLPSPAFLHFVAQWKGFSAIPELGPRPTGLPVPFDLSRAQEAMDFLIKHFSLPLLTLYGPQFLLQLLWLPTVRVEADTIQITYSTGWMRPLLTAGCNPMTAKFSPATLQILESLLFWNDFMNDERRLADIKKTFQSLKQTNLLIQICAPSIPPTLRTVLGA